MGLAFPALLLIAAGTALYFWCAADFVRVGRGTPAPMYAPKTLVVSGPYRWTRNPMYAAVLSILAGEVLWTESPRLIVYAAIVAVLFHLFAVLYEERALRTRFGASYAAYRKAVPRWGLARTPYHGA